jgi:hypothetical protein
MKEKKINKKCFNIVCKVLEIGELLIYQREGKDTLYKKMLVVRTKDGQKFFPEIRNKKISLLDGINVGDNVDLQFTFEGSEKNDKRYNNVYINNITKQTNEKSFKRTSNFQKGNKTRTGYRSKS